MKRIDKEAMQELLEMEAVTVCSTLTSLLGRSVKIVVKDVAEAAPEELPERLPRFHVVLPGVRRSEGSRAGQMYVCGKDDIGKLANFMMGLPVNTENPLDVIALSTVREVAVQSVSTGVAEQGRLLGREFQVTFSPIHMEYHADRVMETVSTWEDASPLMFVTFSLTVEGVACVEVYGVYSANIGAVMGMTEAASGTKGHAGKGMFSVREAVFPEFQYTPLEYRTEHFGEEHERLSEIELDVTVHIGNTVCTLKEILDLKKGQVLVLDKQAGSPADVQVNDVLIGRGDVLVTGDRFGSRIIEITGKEK